MAPPVAPVAQNLSAAASCEPGVTGAFALLDAPLRRAVAKAGYTEPTPVQEKCLPVLLAGSDCVATAQTGTGKTAAFVLPLLQRLSRENAPAKSRRPSALVLAPTRELAAQIAESVSVYGRYLNLRHGIVFGGVSQFPQAKALQQGVHILVATPGRLLDLMNQRLVSLQDVRTLVLDEVDRMLDMGFLPAIREIEAALGATRQNVFFSATLPSAVERLVKGLAPESVRIAIAPEKAAAERIDQKVLFVGSENKAALLVSLLKNPSIKKAVVFTQMKHAANKVVKTLETAAISGTAIHGNKSQGARTRALDGFRKGRYRVLVATDVAARGLDVDGITHVINYDLPLEAETYVHRIGRTARAGASGGAISFCAAAERACLRGIERLLGAPVSQDIGHEFHCERARGSTAPLPTFGGARRKEGSARHDARRRPRRRR